MGGTLSNTRSVVVWPLDFSTFVQDMQELVVPFFLNIFNQVELFKKGEIYPSDKPVALSFDGNTGRSR